MNRAIFSLVALLGLAAVAEAQVKRKPYPPDGVMWAKSWEDATTEAIARNVPIHFAYHSNAKVCLDTAEEYKKPAFIQQSRAWVNAVACKETHDEEEVQVGKDKKKWCTVYWGIECKAHVDMAGAISKISKETSHTIPLSWFLDTTGKELGKKVSSGSVISGGEVQNGMDKALKSMPGDRISFAEWQGYQKARTDIKEGFEKGEWKRAMTGAQILQKAKSKALSAEGKEAMNKLSEKGDELLKEATDLLATDKEKAKKQLKMIAADFKPLICSNRAEEFLKGIK
jgi:hypothetical protein